MPMMKNFQFAITLALCSASAHAMAANLVVVVSAKSPVVNLRADEVTDIFLGKTATFPGDGEAIPLDQPETTALRHEFYAKVVGKSPALLKAHWSKLIFTGRGHPPKEVPNSETIKKLIASNPRYIGYIDDRAVDSSVKVVYVAK